MTHPPIEMGGPGRTIRLVSSCLSANSEATKEAKLVALATLLGVAVSSFVERWVSVLGLVGHQKQR